MDKVEKVTGMDEERDLRLMLSVWGSNQHNQLGLALPLTRDNGAMDQLNSPNTVDFLISIPETRKFLMAEQKEKGEETVVDGAVALYRSSTPSSLPLQVLAGGAHTGVLTEKGHLYLWGWDDNGQCSGPRSGTAIQTIDNLVTVLSGSLCQYGQSEETSVPVHMIEGISKAALGHTVTVLAPSRSFRCIYVLIPLFTI